MDINNMTITQLQEFSLTLNADHENKKKELTKSLIIYQEKCDEVNRCGEIVKNFEKELLNIETIHKHVVNMIAEKNK